MFVITVNVEKRDIEFDMKKSTINVAHNKQQIQKENYRREFRHGSFPLTTKQFHHCCCAVVDKQRSSGSQDK